TGASDSDELQHHEQADKALYAHANSAETASEPEPEPEPELEQMQPQPIDETLSASLNDDLVAQQQDILQQAQDYGHQPMDYDQYQAVSMDEQPSEIFSGEYQGLDYEDTPLQQPAPLDESEQSARAKPSTSTADLIALRNKLKQSQREEEEGAGQVKKSESSTALNLTSMRAQNEQTTDKVVEENQAQQQVAPITPDVETPIVNTPFEAEPVVNSAPPWPLENESSTAASSPFSVSDDPIKSPFSAEKTVEEAEVFDSRAHLDEENVGDVTLEISAFLPDKQKVLKARQVDAWSKLIEDMQVTALTKQLALHSAFDRQNQTIKLTLLETKGHLISDTAQQQLKQALCLALNETIELEIQLGQPINTPYALQLKVNQVRNEYAREVVKNDPGIQLLQQQFAAKVDEQSIQAR
ncbi:MAG: DNA polymerase III subunit gamma/tau C-terminal domain-containing protein, partial [Lentilitoribacter sp.]